MSSLFPRKLFVYATAATTAAFSGFQFDSACWAVSAEPLLSSQHDVDNQVDNQIEHTITDNQSTDKLVSTESDTQSDIQSDIQHASSSQTQQSLTEVDEENHPHQHKRTHRKDYSFKDDHKDDHRNHRSNHRNHKNTLKVHSSHGPTTLVNVAPDGEVEYLPSDGKGHIVGEGVAMDKREGELLKA
jgi:hypothetical protein